MNHADHVALLEGEPGIRQRLGLPLRGTGGVWADLGAGEGAFTLALADILGSRAVIFALDRKQPSLERLSMAMRKSFPDVQLSVPAADFTRPLDLPPLDGIVMANSLHFIPHRKKPALLESLRKHLRPGGQFILVEYNVDQGNLWVPHPLSFPTWQNLAARVGYTKTTRLFSRPSRFLNEIYSAVSVVGGPEPREPG